MSNKAYYERWLALKKEIYSIVAEDAKIHNMAMKYIGIKPQSNAVEIVSRLYAKYVGIYNQLCDIYDQMEQVQRRPYLKAIIDAITCRILDLKSSLEEIEVFQYTYPDNALQTLLISPNDIQILCPFFYPFEIRSQELQYIVDEIFSGHRLGDPEPTPSEIEKAEEERLEAERIKQEEKEAEILRKLAMGEEIEESIKEKELNPIELEQRRKHQAYLTKINNIQRMERSRVRIKNMVHKKNKNEKHYLEIAHLLKPLAREELRKRAADLIILIYRKFMELKRRHHRHNLVQEKLGMVIPSWQPPSAKDQQAQVQETRRNCRRQYYEDWLKKNINEKSRVMRLREGDIIEDITYEVKQWFEEWYFELKCFDEFPWPLEGGSIVVVRGETFTIEEYKEWKEEELKRSKKEATNPKTKEQIKQEKLSALAEIKKAEMEAKVKEKKRIADYKKARLNPDLDPGCYVLPDKTFEPILEAWKAYEYQWRIIDRSDADDDVKRGFINELITENAYKECQLELRTRVDNKMRLELKLLRKALKRDIAEMGENPPILKKRKRPRPEKPPKPEKLKPEVMFQFLVDEGIVKIFPKLTLEDFWGNRNFAAADLRAIPWTPKFPPPCIGDVREQVRVQCLLALGSTCPNVPKTQLIVGHKRAGKRTLIYAVASETNSILIDLSPFNVYDKCLGARNQKRMFAYVSKIAKIMQPTVIMVANADKLFYKNVPKEDKAFNPTRLSKDFYKQIIKSIGEKDRILVLGTASEPWLAKQGGLSKVFPSVILCPRTDYASMSFILNQELMKYHGVDRTFNLNSVAQGLKGYDVHTIRKVVENVLTPERISMLYHKPLQPNELVNAALAMHDATVLDAWDFQIYTDWYQAYTPWGNKYIEYMAMLESQHKYKLKKDQKNKTKKK